MSVNHGLVAKAIERIEVAISEVEGTRAVIGPYMDKLLGPWSVEELPGWSGEELAGGVPGENSPASEGDLGKLDDVISRLHQSLLRLGRQVDRMDVL